jgi:hypothetical protein
VIHALRLRGPLAADPTARILHALVLSLAIWFAIWSIGTLPFYPNLTARLVRLRFVIVAEAVPVATLVLLRLGHFRQAVFFYLAGQWVHATYRIALSGSIQVTSTAYYITLPILAAWLMGFREAFWTAGVCLGSAPIFALDQGHNGVLPSASLSTPSVSRRPTGKVGTGLTETNQRSTAIGALYCSNIPLAPAGRCSPRAPRPGNGER